MSNPSHNPDLDSLVGFAPAPDMEAWREEMNQCIASSATLNSLEEQAEVAKAHYKLVRNFVGCLPLQDSVRLMVADNYPERTLGHVIWMKGTSDTFYDVAYGAYYIIGERPTTQPGLSGDEARDLLVHAAGSPRLPMHAHDERTSFNVHEPLRRVTVWTDEFAECFRRAFRSSRFPFSEKLREKMFDHDVGMFAVGEDSEAMKSHLISPHELRRYHSRFGATERLEQSGMTMYMPRHTFNGEIEPEELDSFHAMDFMKNLAVVFDRRTELSQLYHHLIERNNHPEHPVPPMDTAHDTGSGNMSGVL